MGKFPSLVQSSHLSPLSPTAHPSGNVGMWECGRGRDRDVICQVALAHNHYCIITTHLLSPAQGTRTAGGALARVCPVAVGLLSIFWGVSGKALEAQATLPLCIWMYVDW
jgi:hypothetical protein